MQVLESEAFFILYARSTSVLYRIKQREVQ